MVNANPDDQDDSLVCAAGLINPSLFKFRQKSNPGSALLEENRRNMEGSCILRVDDLVADPEAYS